VITGIVGASGALVALRTASSLSGWATDVRLTSNSGGKTDIARGRRWAMSRHRSAHKQNVYQVASIQPFGLMVAKRKKKKIVKCFVKGPKMFASQSRGRHG
jgi:hypothetical protein